LSTRVSILKKALDEESLVAHLRRIAGHTSRGWLAHLRFSKLCADTRNQNMMFAFDRLRDVAVNHDGTFYAMSNQDVVCVFNTPRIRQIRSDIGRIVLLFGDDPLFVVTDGQQPQLSVYFDLDAKFDDAQALAANFLAAARGTVPGAVGMDGAATGVLELNADNLTKIWAAIEGVDIAPAVRHQTIYMMTDGAPPLAIFDEIYVSIRDLERATIPEIRFSSERWLFQHMTKLLDRRVLDLLAKLAVLTPVSAPGTLAQLMRQGRFSINLNISSVLSPEFSALDGALPESVRKDAVVEFQKIDVFSDVGAYIYARDRLRQRGYGTAIDGISYLSLPFVAREDLGCDFVKVAWSPEMDQGTEFSNLDSLKAVVKRSGADRFILCRCDSPQAIAFGRSLGISLFQGWHADAMAARPEATAALA
jgi:hypothetical protein